MGKEAVLDAITELGGQRKTASLLGVTQQAVSQWVQQGYIPDKQLAVVALVVSVPVNDLRRPLDGPQWREMHGGGR